MPEKQSAVPEINPEQPFTTKISDEKQFSGRWIPNHNAKLIKEAIENGNAPFLPNADGNFKPKAIYNANTGYCLNAKELIPLQIIQEQNGYESRVVGTRTLAKKVQTNLKENEKGFFYNFRREDNSIGTAQLYFAEQMEHADRLLDYMEKLPITKGRVARDATIHSDEQKKHLSITSANPEDYLATFIAASKRNNDVKLVCTPEIAEAFKKNFEAILQNQLAPKKERNQAIDNLHLVLLNADVKANDIVKSIDKDMGRTKTQSTEQKKERLKEIER